MPPRLVHGSPAGQHKGFIPPTAYLCQCHQCFHSSSIDPISLEPVKGRYVGYEEYKKHRSLENKSGLAPATASAAPVQLDPAVGLANLPVSRPVSPPSPSSPISESTQKSTREPPRLKSSNTFRSTLDKILEILDRTTVDSIFDGVKLVFHVPPQRDSDQQQAHSPADPADHDGRMSVHGQDINSGPYALSSNVPANSKIIGYEEWLFESHRIVNQHGFRHADVHVRLRSRVVLKRLEDSLDELERHKRQEWERQRVAEPTDQEESSSIDSGQNQSTVSGT